MGPLGLLSPYPGVSYLFTGDAVNPNFLNNDPYSENYTGGMSNSLWNIANPGGGPLGSLNNSWSASLGETVLKVDGKMKVRIIFFNNRLRCDINDPIKKITSTLLKELDVFARNGIKDELASLDPLLSTAASGKLVYEEGA